VFADIQQLGAHLFLSPHSRTHPQQIAPGHQPHQSTAFPIDNGNAPHIFTGHTIGQLLHQLLRVSKDQRGARITQRLCIALAFPRPAQNISP
jgi:hypothetical protein